MSETVKDAVPHILMKIQDDMAAFRRSLETRFDQVDMRLGQMETVLRKQRRDLSGILVIGKSLAGD